MPDSESLHYPFHSISNLRDLGGIVTEDHRIIIPEKLYRSANLHHADEKDLLTLQEMGLKEVVDLRTEWETAAMPDRLEAGWNLDHLPAYHETTVSQFFGGQEELIQEAYTNMDEAMQGLYHVLIESEQAQKTWRSLFDILLSAENGVLWHCTEGKDRTGIAAALVLSALGVSEENILADYLETNAIEKGVIQEDLNKLLRLPGHHHRHLEADLEGFLEARTEYFEAAQESIRNGWGSWKNYLKQAIGLDENQLKVLKDKYTFRPEEGSLQAK